MTGFRRHSPRPCVIDLLSLSFHGAWGLRLLKGDYAGPLVKIFKPSDTAGVDVYPDPDGMVNVDQIMAYAAGGDVMIKEWYAQQGTGSLTTGSTSTAPRIVIAGVLQTISANRPTAVFDGANSYSALAFSNVNQPFTRCLVARFDSVASGQNVFSDGAQNSLYFSAAGSLSTYAGAPGTFKTGISAGDKATVIERVDGSSSNGRFNGANTSYDPGTLSSFNRSLGAAVTNGGSVSSHAAVSVCEHLMHSADMGATAAATLEANQKAFWGTP